MRALTLRMMPVMALVALLTGCVTINVYFPEAAANKAADRIIDEVMQVKKPAAGQPAPTSDATAPKETQ